MVKHLIDTDIIIDYSNGIEEAIELVKSLGESSLSVSVITVAEVLEGLVGNKGKYELVKEGILSIKSFKVDFDVAECFSKERYRLRKKGMLIDNMDLLIASTALVHNLTLITNNTKHFKRIKGLKIYKST